MIWPLIGQVYIVIVVVKRGGKDIKYVRRPAIFMLNKERERRKKLRYGLTPFVLCVIYMQRLLLCVQSG